jgi:hypothetical protein
MDIYLKNKSRDCILYSEVGSKFKVHKELFGQTQFLRKILSSASERCCQTMEVFCPCSKNELKHLVNFLYDGEIHCEEEFDSLKILENLNKVFGFSKNPVSASTTFKYLPSSIALIFLGCKGQLTRVLAENSYLTLTIIKVGTKESLSFFL